MTVLLLTYDLNKEKKKKEDYDGFYSVIHSYDYIQLSESSYALYTDDDPTTVFMKLRKFIDKDDSVHIITMKKPWAGHTSPLKYEWLESRLPQ